MRKINTFKRLLFISCFALTAGCTTASTKEQSSEVNGHYEHVLVSEESTKSVAITKTQYETVHKDAEYKTVFVTDNK